MLPKQAVAAAKQQLVDIFAGEGIAPPTLEEIWFDQDEKAWVVTFGIRRIDDAGKVIDRLGLRDLKVVRISDQDGSILAIRDRLSDVFAR